MKTFVIGSLLAMIAAGAAMAGETGVINQTGPYEATMQFYLHPAQGFAGKPDAAQPSSPSTSSDESKQTVTRLASRSHRSLSIKTGYGPQSPTK